MYKKLIVLLLSLFVCIGACKKEKQGNNGQNHDRIFYHPDQMVMGADLSYLNQILDHGGQYKDSGSVEAPYVIFRKYGSNVIRFRLFHTPTWTMDVYDPPGTQMYHDYQDVKMGIQKARAQGMQVCLDFHYSDNRRHFLSSRGKWFPSQEYLFRKHSGDW